MCFTTKKESGFQVVKTQLALALYPNLQIPGDNMIPSVF